MGTLGPDSIEKKILVKILAKPQFEKETYTDYKLKMSVIFYRVNFTRIFTGFQGDKVKITPMNVKQKII